MLTLIFVYNLIFRIYLYIQNLFLLLSSEFYGLGTSPRAEISVWLRGEAKVENKGGGTHGKIVWHLPRSPLTATLYRLHRVGQVSERDT